MILTRLIAFGFLGSILAMSRFSRYCRLLNRWDLEPEEAERLQARARWWLTAAGVLLSTAALSIVLLAIISYFPGKRM
ncbi:hypothetical protein AALC17_03010 [Oscillospiraceae bacterium 38-13]